MASRDGESDSDSSYDDLYSNSRSAGSDINIDVPLDSFSSDTDDDDDQNSQSSLETLSSQISDSEGLVFRSSELHPVSIAPFSEVTGPSHNLTPNDNILSYFFLMVQRISSREFPINSTDTLLMNSRKEVTVTQFDMSPQEIKAYFGLQILRSTNQLLSGNMYWSQTSS